MAGYIGSKAVNLSTTGADINGDANIDGDLSFGDNDKAIFGAGSDLQIYHDGSNSIIEDTSTGNLQLITNGNAIALKTSDGEAMLSAIKDGDVKLYYNNALKLATTSTGVDVTGTITSDGLTVDGDITLTAGNKLKFNDDRYFTPENNIDGAEVSANGVFRIKTGTTPAARLLVSGNGDISFYEDTGTTPKFFWDASAESLGIGTSSPTFTSAYGGLHVHSTYPEIHLTGTDSGSGASDGFKIQKNSANHVYLWNYENAFMAFGTNNAERMRIDSSGNLLVGTTDSNVANQTGTTQGVRIAGAQNIQVASTGLSAYFNKLGTDGGIVEFRKSGSTMGSIGVQTGALTVDGKSGYTGVYYGTSGWLPRKSGALIDNSVDLGTTSIRFDDIYATNGTIQTSDRNEKQDIAELTDAEQRVAVACKGLLRKFRWKDAVAEKGDEARTHFGIIAQDLQAAFAAEGLDAGDYAMFISSTWWEHDVEVPAVEAVAEVTETTTDEDGNEVVTVVTEAVEAVDAYTRTDTYDTQEEAPEGATERTRLGVRYSELLAFIIGAL